MSGTPKHQWHRTYLDLDRDLQAIVVLFDVSSNRFPEPALAEKQLRKLETKLSQLATTLEGTPACGVILQVQSAIEPLSGVAPAAFWRNQIAFARVQLANYLPLLTEGTNQTGVE